MLSISVYLALYLTLAALYVRTQALSQCSAPWVPFQSSCYVFATGYPEDWTEAGAFCSRLGAKLAEIETVEENNFLRLHAFEMHAGSHFWVGGTDVLVDGQWIWISTQEKMQFTDWLPGEPNGGLREGCLMLVSGSNNYHWNDANCHSQQSFICEKEVEIGGNPSIIG
uniref:Perlucin-like n=1 Tax=Crassostrea virginica TaxID=6565 RepID=A0A8B8AQ90_CRAVI|nr:perlucin-like [Crassostrea virginica]